MRHTRILSFDPGTTCLGWAVSQYQFDTDKFQVIKFGNVKPSDNAKKLKEECVVYTRQLMSLFLIEDVVRELMETYSPQYVVSEDAFYNPRRGVHPYIALKLCINTIARIVMDYKLGLFKISPCGIKSIVTGNGHADKLTIQDAILNNPQISFKAAKQIAFDKMVEHEADAIAVGYAFVKKGLCLG